MEAYRSHCPHCNRTYNWSGYKTGIGKSAEQLAQMRREQTVCRYCDKEGLQTGLDHDSPDGQVADDMAQIAVGAILGLLGPLKQQPVQERQTPYPDPENVPVPRLEDSPPFELNSTKPEQPKVFEYPTCDEICPSCDSALVILTVVDHMFEYGDVHAGHKVILLRATLPVFTCGKCGSSWLNECGAALKDYAVHKHLESLKTDKDKDGT